MDVKFNYKKEVDVVYPILFLLIVACAVLFCNLKALYKIDVNEKSIIQTFVFSKKKKIIDYETIIKSEREFVDGYTSSEVGEISPGYHHYKFTLSNKEVFIISPKCFENYNEIISKINANRNF